MITKKSIETVVNRLVKTYDPLKIYLFGSYAWGKPTEDSDLDFLVIVDQSDESPYERAVTGHLALIGMPISKDIKVYTKEEFSRRSKDKTSLSYKIKHEGKALYAKL